MENKTKQNSTVHVHKRQLSELPPNRRPQVESKRRNPSHQSKHYSDPCDAKMTLVAKPGRQSTIQLKQKIRIQNKNTNMGL